MRPPPIDATGVPVIAWNPSGLLFAPPGSDEFPCLPYHAARLCAQFIYQRYPDRRDEMVEWAKWANRQALPRALRACVRRTVGWEAEQRDSRWWFENMPRAERKRIGRAWGAHGKDIALKT